MKQVLLIAVLEFLITSHDLHHKMEFAYFSLATLNSPKGLRKMDIQASFQQLSKPAVKYI